MKLSHHVVQSGECHEGSDCCLSTSLVTAMLVMNP